MELGKGNREGLLNGVRRRNVVAASLAVVVSFLIHVLVIQQFPPLPVGRPADVKTFSRFHSVELGDVRLGFSLKKSRPRAFRPEDPRQTTEVRVDDMMLALGEVLEVGPKSRNVPMAGEAEAVAEPVADERGAWEPRQEILKIEQALFDEEVSALPRQYISDVARVEEAVDVTWPMAAGSLQALGVSGVGSAGAAGLAVAMPDGLAGPGPGESVEEEVQRLEQAEASALLDEEPVEITDATPVERLLRIDVVTYKAPDEEEVYFKVEIARHGAEVLPVLPRDILLIQDCSESMTQRKLNDCKKGLHTWVNMLSEKDHFNIMGFREAPYMCFEEGRQIDAATRARARWFIEAMRSHGKTDVYASLEQLLRIESEAGRPVIAVLVTDGRPTQGVVDSSDIIEQFSELNGGRNSVFSIGGGRRVNRFLLDLLSYKNRGDSLIVRDRSEIPEALEQWAVELSRPVLSDLRYRFSGVEGLEVYPKTLTHLYLDRSLVIYGRCPADERAVAFQIVGSSGESRHDMVFTLGWEGSAPGDEEIRTRWAWHKAYDLIGEHVRTRQDGVMARIEDLARKYGLRIPYE